jgi:hypothetical protein
MDMRESPELSLALDDFLAQAPDLFHMEGKMEDPISLVIPKIQDGPLALPLSSETLGKMRDLAKPSPFGKGVATVHDDN